MVLTYDSGEDGPERKEKLLAKFMPYQYIRDQLGHNGRDVHYLKVGCGELVIQTCSYILLQVVFFRWILQCLCTFLFHQAS